MKKLSLLIVSALLVSCAFEAKYIRANADPDVHGVISLESGSEVARSGRWLGSITQVVDNASGESVIMSRDYLGRNGSGYKRVILSPGSYQISGVCRAGLDHSRYAGILSTVYLNIELGAKEHIWLGCKESKKQVTGLMGRELSFEIIAVETMSGD